MAPGPEDDTVSMQGRSSARTPEREPRAGGPLGERPDHPVAAAVPWCGGDPFQTRLLEAMSLLAPEVERFVIDAVRDALRTLDPADPRQALGLAFMREEAAHSASHHAFNRHQAAGGIEVAAGDDGDFRYLREAVEDLAVGRADCLAEHAKWRAEIRSRVSATSAQSAARSLAHEVQVCKHEFSGA